MFKVLATFFCIVAALANVVLAQNVIIAQPTANANVTAGSRVVVQLDKPDSLTGSEDLTVVIGASQCQSLTECPDVTEVLGDILYHGPYTPERHNDDYNPYQKISVVVPSWYSGPVQLGVAHFFLLGAGLSATLQFTNTTLNVVAPH